MATAKIHETTASSCIELMKYSFVAEESQPSAKIVDIHAPVLPETTHSTEIAAPKLPPEDPTPSQGLTLEDKLAFIRMLNTLIEELSKFKNSINTMQSEASTILVAIEKDQVAKSQKEYADWKEKYDAAQHQSGLAKFFGYFVAAISVVVGFVVGGPVGGLAALAICAFMLSPASKDLDDAMDKAGIPSGACIVIKISICAAMTGGFCALESATTTTVTEVAEETAVTAASKAAQGAEDIEEASAEEAVSVTPKEPPAETPAPKTSNWTTAGRILNYGSQSNMVFNPLGDLVTKIMIAGGMDKDKADMIGHMVGQIISVLASFSGAIAATKGALAGMQVSKLTASLQEWMGAANFTKVSGGLMALRTGFSGIQSSFTIQSGMSTIEQGQIEKDMGQTKEVQIVYDALINALQQVIQSVEKSFVSEINGCYMNYQFMNEPGQAAQEILG